MPLFILKLPQVTSAFLAEDTVEACSSLLMNRGNSGWQRRRKKTEARSRKARATTAKKHPVQQTDQTDITNGKAPHSKGAFLLRKCLWI